MIMVSTVLALQHPDPTIPIRPVRLTDVEELHRVCWQDRSQSAVHRLIARTQQFAVQGRGLGVVVMTAPGSDKLLGYGQLTAWPRCGEISDLYVDDRYRSRGIGTAMIQYLVRTSRQMLLPAVEIGVALSNPRALALYRRLGFTDDRTVQVDLGSGTESVRYLMLDVPPLRP